jgi:acyl dehydratase
MKAAEFLVEVTQADAQHFAEISGDWNPLHTDETYAKSTRYGRPILHGAFSAGLMSRMAGMYLPGRHCLLHAMKLKFLAPIQPPARLIVSGQVIRESAEMGQVEVVITDAESGSIRVEGSYEFGYHQEDQTVPPPIVQAIGTSASSKDPVILVTGASGGLGSAVMRQLGEHAFALEKTGIPDDSIADRPIAGIIHCGWPHPDNTPLTNLGRIKQAAINHHIAEPLTQILGLAELLASRGTKEAPLILVGSTFAYPGRHNYRTPLYSLSKTIIPALVRILAVELGTTEHRCIGVEFDVLDGGMNAELKAGLKVSHANRSPRGLLATPDDAAAQITWILENRSALVSGAVIRLTSGSMP